MDIIETEIGRERLYSGKILDLDRVSVTLPNGKTAMREVVMHKGATAVIAVDKDGRVPMVRQYRVAVGGETLEIPAGKYDHPGEDAAVCAARELKEETGLTAQSLTKIAAFDTTPGFSSERITLFLATGLDKGAARPDDDEFLNVSWFTLDELYQMALRAEITDSKTLIAVLLAKQLV